MTQLLPASLLAATTLLLLAGCERSEAETPPTSPGTPTRETTLSDPGTPTSGVPAPAFDVPERFRIHGHRGARGLKPENTLPSFEAALDLEVDVLELDLHLSKNDRLVVWHDPFVYDSKCRSASPDSALQLGATREDEPGEHAMVRRLATGLLARYACDQNPSPERFPDQDNTATALAVSSYRIVTLDELFTFVERYARSEKKSASQRANAASVHFNIELKRHPENPEYIGDGFDGVEPGLFERALVEMIQSRELGERVIVQSFVSDSLWAVHALDPNLRLSILEEERGAPLIDYARRGAHIWSPRAELVTKTSMAEAREAGLQVHPWTVNEPLEMQRLIDLGVDGIISDRPDLLVARRK